MPNFLDIALNAPRLRVLEDDEYQVQITKITPHESKDKETGAIRPSLKIQAAVIGHPDAFDLIEYVSIPTPADDEATKVKKINRLYNFLDAFSIPYSETGFDLEAAVGAKGWAKLTTESEPGREDRNRARWMAPRS